MLSLAEERTDARRESRLRKAVSREGYALRTCRSRHPWALDYGRHHIVDTNDVIVAGGYHSDDSMTLDEGAAWVVG